MTLLYEAKEENYDNIVNKTDNGTLSSKGYRFDGQDDLFFARVDIVDDLGADVVVSGKEVYVRIFNNAGDGEYDMVADSQEDAVRIANKLAKEIKDADTFKAAYAIAYDNGLED